MRSMGLSAAALVFLASCGAQPLDVSLIALNVVGGVTVSPPSPVEFQITATNVGVERVVWGRGSSSCQFGLVVMNEEIGRHDISFRACTDDYGEQGLDPGQSHTETISWAGQISVSGLMAPLVPGAYQVVATAGNDYESPPLSVTVIAEP